MKEKHKPKQFTDEELMELINSISGPTFKYMMKRISNKIITDKQYDNMPIDKFIAILVSALVPVNVNVINWISNFYTASTNEKIDTEMLIHGFIGQLNSQMGIILH